MIDPPWSPAAAADRREAITIVDLIEGALAEVPDRLKCLNSLDKLEVAKAGENGPRITYIPLISDLSLEMQGVLEIHSAHALSAADLRTVGHLHHV